MKNTKLVQDNLLSKKKDSRSEENWNELLNWLQANAADLADIQVEAAMYVGACKHVYIK